MRLSVMLWKLSIRLDDAGCVPAVAEIRATCLAIRDSVEGRGIGAIVQGEAVGKLQRPVESHRLCSCSTAKLPSSPTAMSLT
jgi:hypothetical protein